MTQMPPSQELTLERVHAAPSLNGPRARGVAYSPDGQRVTYLVDGKDGRGDLWQFDTETGETRLLVPASLLADSEGELSEEEKALRERRRLAGSSGIVDYDWGTATQLLVPIGGDLSLVELGADGPAARQLTETEAFEYDARLSPEGRYASFIRDGALHVIELATGKERQVTPDADPEAAVRYGVAEFVAQEEMSRYTGYWWSPDERFIAYTKVDESGVDIIPRFDISAEDVTVIEQRYPRAGRPNAVIELFVTDLKTGEVSAVGKFGPDTYLARADWGPGPALYVQSVDRDQTAITYERALPPSFSPARLFTEHQPAFINLSDDFTALEDGRIVFTQEADQGAAGAFRHIHVMADDGSDLRPVTTGDWAVDAVEAVAEESRTVFFTGRRDTPLERHLYSVPLAGGAPQRLTELGKSWSVTVAPDGKTFVGTASSPGQPPQTGLYRTDGMRLAWIEENVLDADHPYAPFMPAHAASEFGTLTAEDGQTLHYSLLLPPGADRSTPLPAVVQVYGGPHVQTVEREWGRVGDQYLARQGYAVFRLDNRGTAARGKRFEDAIFRQMGQPEVRDQLQGVAWLKDQPFIDPDRIAIQGWSYGGYMTLMTVLQAEPGTFAAAVSGAPVTDWSLYDTFYTERYMDTPEDNPEGYRDGSVFHQLEGFVDRHGADAFPPLLLIHGMADDNVTFDNSTRLMADLQGRGIPFELMTYPGERHGVRTGARPLHLSRVRHAFLERQLGGDTAQ